MIAGGVGGDALGQLFGGQLRGGVVGTAELERSDALEVLALDEHLRADEGVEGAGGQHRGVVGDAVEACSGVADVVEGHGQGGGHGVSSSGLGLRGQVRWRGGEWSCCWVTSR